MHSNSEFEAVGIGPAIVARIFHRHHGEIWAEAEVDKGATIYLTLAETEEDKNNQFTPYKKAS